MKFIRPALIVEGMLVRGRDDEPEHYFIEYPDGRQERMMPEVFKLERFTLVQPRTRTRSKPKDEPKKKGKKAAKVTAAPTSEPIDPDTLIGKAHED